MWIPQAGRRPIAISTGHFSAFGGLALDPRACDVTPTIG